MLGDLGAQELEESAELGVSELVTNAVLHAHTPCTVSVLVQPGGGVRIAVADRSPVPVQERSFGLVATTGRGLRLVASVSTAWGVEVLPAGGGPGKSVRFEPCAVAVAMDLGDFSAELAELL